MALYNYFTRVGKDDDSKKTLSAPKEMKMADEAVAKALESAKSTGRGSTTRTPGNREHKLGIMLQIMAQLKLH